jgi:uncharacterized protein YdcH (DUF465 family)
MDDLVITIFYPDEYEAALNADKKENQRQFKKYQSKDIQAIAKVSKISLINWTQQGAIIPFEDARGRGKVRLYDYQNLIEAMICRELNKLSIGIRYQLELLDWLRRVKFNFKFTFTDGSHIDKYLVDGEKVIQKIKEIENNPPSMEGKKISEIRRSKSNKDEIHRSVTNIINETEEPKKTNLNKWMDDLSELVKQYDSMKPGKQSLDQNFSKVLGFYEYLKLYSFLSEPFFLIITINDDSTMKSNIYDMEGSSMIFKTKTAILISLLQLFREAGNVYE